MNSKLTSNTYDPETYWDYRAASSSHDLLKAVSVEGALDEENRCIDRIQRHLMKAAINTIKKHSSLDGKKVLDFGCGTGRWMEFFSNFGMDYHGIDISREMLKIASASHKEASFMHIEDNIIPFPDSTFHVVCSLTVLHHNMYKQQKKMISEMIRVLRKDGFLLLFEACGARKESDTIMFPRQLSDWKNLVEYENLTLVWFRCVRYWFLRSLIVAVLSRLYVKKTSGQSNPPAAAMYRDARFLRLRKILSNIDSILGPLFIRLIPPKYQNRAVMIFVKS